MVHTQPARFIPRRFLAKVGEGKTTLNPKKLGVLFSQGDAANAVFYIQKGRVKLTAISAQGKEAVIGILEQGAFIGEGCLAGQLVCVATATALDASVIARIDKAAMMRVLHDEPTFAALFMAYLLSHSIRVQEDLSIISLIQLRSGLRASSC